MDAVCVLHYSFISSIQVFQTEGLQPDSIRGVIIYSLEEMVQTRFCDITDVFGCFKLR